jgi:thiol-disulfide isomerase/thioredoxin
MREIILVGAPWCGACKAMGDWFLSVDCPDVMLRYADIENPIEAENLIIAGANISSLPTVLFRENQRIVQEITGAMNRRDLEATIRYLWPDVLEVGFMADLVSEGFHGLIGEDLSEQTKELAISAA